MRKVLNFILFWACVIGPLVWLFFATSCTRTPRERAIRKHDRLVAQWDLHDTIVRTDTVYKVKTIYLPGKVIHDTILHEITKDCPEPARKEITKFFKDNCVSLPDTSRYAGDDLQIKVWKSGSGLGVWYKNLRIKETETVHTPCPTYSDWDAFRQISGYLAWSVWVFIIVGIFIGRYSKR